MVTAKFKIAEKNKGYTTYEFSVTGLGEYDTVIADVDAAGKVINAVAVGDGFQRREYKQCPQWLKDAVVDARRERNAQSNWGGIRAGQGGRPKGEVAMTKTYYLRCTEELHAKLKEKGSDWVREVLEGILHVEETRY